MIMKVTIAMLLLLVLGCANNSKQYEDIEYKNISKISDMAYTLDSVIIVDDQISLTGLWNISANRLIFSDEYLPQLVEYDLNGKRIDLRLRHGRGPNEISSVILHTAIGKDGTMIAHEGNNLIYFIDKNFNIDKKDRQFLSPIDTEELNSLLQNADPKSLSMYDYDFDSPRMLYTDQGNIIFPVVSEHINFNPFVGDVQNYYDNAPILGVYNMESGRIEEIFGSYPPSFDNKRFPGHLISLLFTQRNSDIIYGFRCDPNIYVMNSDRDVERAFGVAAKSLEKVEYPVHQDIDSALGERNRDLRNEGYYTGILSSGDYIYRSYKNPKQNGGGIQIYQNDILIRDIPTHTAPTLVGADNSRRVWLSTPPDEDNERVMLYRLKI